LMEFVKQKNLNIQELAKTNPNICTPDMVDMLQSILTTTEPRFIRAGYTFLEILIDDPNLFKDSQFSEHFKSLWKIKFPFRDKTLPMLHSQLDIKQFENQDRNQKYLEMVKVIKESFNK
jgi:hypothetical protein